MNTNENLTADGSVDAAQPASGKPRKRRWKIVAGLLLLAVAIWGGWMLLSPPADVSSSITVEIGGTDDDPENDDEELTGDSLLSRMNNKSIEAAEHPFDPLLEVAEATLKHIDETVADYTGTITSQVKLRGSLQAEQKMFCKIRHARDSEDDPCGFSVYLRFLKPKSDQEVIWVDGWNDNMLAGHKTIYGFNNRANLKPDSLFAMTGSRHPVTEIGFRKLLAKMVEKGNHDREYGECEAKIKRNLVIDERKCVMLEVTHPIKRKHFDFHVARIYLDQELEIPIGYEGYWWPKLEGGEPVLIESYFYTDLKLNVGLQDSDFDPDNEAYGFPPAPTQ